MQDQQPVEREAWRRALEREGGEPPRATDERIRAEARRALAPRTGRWWLPASLAASLVLAVMMVQVQYQDSRIPIFAPEADLAPPPPAAKEPGAAPEAADAAATEAPAVLQDAPPALPPPEQSSESRSAMPPAEATEEFVPAPMIELPAAPVAQPQSGAVDAVGSLRSERASQKMRTDARTPEAWYADIAQLRAAGRDEEARTELAKLEEAHPGWLERHHPEDRPDPP
jgi:hypothetical protein